jgi:hypothetical protein
MGRKLLMVGLFLLILPFVLVMPPSAFAVFSFVAYTLYFYRRNSTCGRKTTSWRSKRTDHATSRFRTLMRTRNRSGFGRGK